MSDGLNDGINIVAANVDLNLTRFIESAEKMGTYLDVLNLQLKELSNIKVGSMSIGNLTRDLDNINRIAIAEAEGQNRITLARERGAIDQERILSQVINSERESATRIESILAQRAGNEELNSARISAVREQSNATIARTNAARIATEEATNERSATAAAQRIALEETTGARLNQIAATTQLNQARITTEGLRQQRMVRMESEANAHGIIGAVSSGINNAGETLTRHAGWILSTVAFMGAIDLFKEGIVDFESNLAGVEQVLEEAYHKMGRELSPEVMAAIGENFSVIAERWGESVQEVLQGAKDWGRQYKDLNTIQELVNSTTLLSVVDNLSLKESVKGLEATMNQYGMIARNAGEAQEYSMRIVDSWSAVAHKSMISALDLAQGNEKAASSARMVGIDFDNLQGMIAAGVRATGRSGNELGNTLKTMFASLHSDDAVKQLHKLGVEVKDLEGNFRPAQQVFADLMIAMAGTKYNMEEVVQAVSSGKFQWSKAAAILGDYDTYVKATAQSINSAGLAQQYMAVQMDTVSRKASQLHQALISLMTSAGNSGLTGVLKGLLDNLRYLVDGLNNGGMKAVAFGISLVGIASVMNKITLALEAATVAQESFNVATAVGDALVGNFVGIVAAAAIVGVTSYSISLGKAAGAQLELIEQQKQAVEQHKQMSDQYSREIDFMGQLEEQHRKLTAASKISSNTDEQKANINKSLEATEESLAITIGESSATKVKDAGYTHQAFESVVKSLRGKQESEKVAWNNSKKLVAEATIHMQTEINKQIEAVNAAITAYGALGKLQETGLYIQKQFAWAKYNISPTPDNAKAVDDINGVISEFYKEQQAAELNKLYAKQIQLGSPYDPTSVPDIPSGSGFNETPFGDDDKNKKKKKESTAEHEELTEALLREINAQHVLTKEKSDALSKERESALSAKDYQLTLSKTNELLASQSAELAQLQEAHNKINALKDSALSSASSQFGDINRWFTGNDNQESVAYVREHNEASDDTRKIMDVLFQSMQKMRNAWMENSKAIKENVEAQKAVKQSLTDLISSQADEAISTLKKYYENQKALDDDAYTDKVDNLDKIHQKIMDNLDDELAKQEETINGQIQAIDRLASAEDYNKNLKKSQSEAQDIQNQISELSRDTSYEGKARVADLQKQLAEKNSSIEDMQSTHSDDLRKQNLQDQLAAIKKISDAQKAAETASYNATKLRYAADKKLADEKYNNMMADEQHWAEVKKAIIEGNIKDINTALKKFSDGFTADLTAKAKEIDKSFKEIIKTINAVKSAASNVSADVNISSGDTSGLTQGATGGRLASWGPQGKAMLVHQNELLVNAQDSRNIIESLNAGNALMASIRNINLSSILSASLPSMRTPQLAAASPISHVTVPTKIEFHVTSTDGVISKKNLELASNYVIKQIEKGQTIRGR